MNHIKPINGMLGFCVADALGVPVEFNQRRVLSSNPVREMRGNGTHNQEPGTWSDDSSQLFCVTESLCDGYNLEAIAENLKRWYYDNYWTARGRVFDVGATTYSALEMLRLGVHPSKSGADDVMDNGNGSLMRSLPLAYILKDEWDFKYRQGIIHEVSAITHAHRVAQIGCVLYVEFAIQLLHGETKESAYAYCQQVGKAFYNNHRDRDHLSVFNRIINDKIYEYDEHEIDSSGFIVDTLEACFWSLFRGDNYYEAVLCAVNLGNDTDTIGALTGGLAGIIYGASDIPREWVDEVARLNDIIALSKKFERTLSVQAEPDTNNFIVDELGGHNIESVKKVLLFHDYFNNPNFEFNDKVASLFRQSLIKEGLILTSFDWPHWDKGRDIFKHPERINDCDFVTLTKLLTAVIRNDRFCSGAYFSCVRNGSIKLILRRMKSIIDNLK